MSLYGALFGGVSGLRAQSSKIGMISDNIANVNTIGYKQADAAFQTLVVNSTSAGAYQTGGVRASTVYSIDKQGLLQSTESSTDIAISGNGFFVVKASPDYSTLSTPYYTRAGSFTQDSLGNFINAQGYYLQGWPLDREGRLPGEVGNLNTTSYNDLTSLQTVNVQSASGSAQATSTVELGANLKAGEVVYPGQEGVFTLDSNNLSNRNQPADAIIVGSDYWGATNQGGADSVRRGDGFTLNTGNGVAYTYEYGGYTAGRKVSTSVSNYGDSNFDNQAQIALDASTDIEYGPTTTTFDITIPNHNLITGDKITLSGINNAAGATPLTQLNTTHTVTWVDANTVRITVATPYAGAATPGVPIGGAADPMTADTRVSVFQGNILDATDANGNFLQLTGVNGFTADALSFTVTNEKSGTVTFRYTSATPNTQNGEFNSLSTLAQAINSVNGLTARVVDGRLVVGGEDANQSVTFANGDALGATDGSKRGIDWVKELGVTDVSVSNNGLRYNSVQGLANLVNSQEGLSATVDNPLSQPTLHLVVDDPLDTISFSDLPVPDTIPAAANNVTINNATGTYTSADTISVTIQASLDTSIYQVGDSVYVTGLGAGGGLPGALPNGGPFEIESISATSITIKMAVTQPTDLTTGSFTAGAGTISHARTQSQGSMLAHLGLQSVATGQPTIASLNGAAYTTPYTSGLLPPKYDPSGSVGQNMASGEITAQFSRNIRVYDSLGSGHDVRASFIKVAQNTWAVEIHAIPEDEITPGAGLVDGQIATGTITFNGDGTLRSISSGLSGDQTVVWRNGSASSAISFDLGTAGQAFGTAGATTIGLADGLSQFDSAYNVNFANQNGAPVGQLVSVSIDDNGYVIASYSNGETQSLYKLPLADFANPNGLRPVSGNVFAQTRESGEQNLREAGTNGTGTIVGAALEQSNVDLAEQLTDMIVAQRSYQANTKVIKTADELLDQLNQI